MPMMSSARSVEDSVTYCTIYVKFRQSQTSFLAGSETTLDAAKLLAEDSVKKSGHHCNGACHDWKVVLRFNNGVLVSAP